MNSNRKLMGNYRITNELQVRPFRSSEPEKPRIFSQAFGNLPDNVYGEVLLARNYSLKTRNLNGEKIPLIKRHFRDVIFYDTEIGDLGNMRVRVEKMGPIKSQFNSAPAVIVLAVSRESLDEELSYLSIKLWAGGFFACAIFGGVLSFALKRSLKPLRVLGEQASQISAETLNVRFSEEKAPSDLRPIIVGLNGMMENVESSFLRERRFSADLAHELRVPLAAIRSTSEVALKWPEESSSEDFSEIAAISIQLQQTLDGLLQLARFESGAASVVCEEVNLADLISEVISLHSKCAEKRGIIFETDFADDKFSVESDPRLLRMIFSNLINNAVEYATENSAIILRSNSSEIFVCQNLVTDLDESDLPKIFDRLWRKDGVRTEFGHSGLGLSIVKSCAEVLGFCVEARLTLENRFCISLSRK